LPTVKLENEVGQGLPIHIMFMGAVAYFMFSLCLYTHVL